MSVKAEAYMPKSSISQYAKAQRLRDLKCKSVYSVCVQGNSTAAKMSIDSVNSIYCSRTMPLVSDDELEAAGLGLEEDVDEQSGWTSYLDTFCSTPQCYAESLSCNSLSVLENISSLSANNIDEIEGLETALTEEESHGSTVSDASSGRASQPKGTKKCGAINSKKCMNLQQTSVCYHQNCGQFGAQFELIREQLEDTATSSPISPQHGDTGTAAVAAGKDFYPFAAMQYGAHEDVSQRFKILETLIPQLKEVAVRANEEEILKAIIDHVHALELKVELLSMMSGMYHS